MTGPPGGRDLAARAAELAALLPAAAVPGTRPPRVMYRDDTLPHQIRIFLVGSSTGKIAVSCVCRRNGHGGAQGECYEPLETRTRWEADEAQAVYRAHLAEAAP